MLATVTGRQRIEMDGKAYDLTWYGEKATVRVLTKRGPRTLNGHGRAYRPAEIAKVMAKAKAEQK